MYFVDLEKAFDRLPRKVLGWAMRKKGIPKVLIRSVMSLHERTKTRVREDSELSEKFYFKVGMRYASVLSPFFALVVVVVTEFARDGSLGELLYADELVLMIETIEGLRNKSTKWKDAFVSKFFKVNRIPFFLIAHPNTFLGSLSKAFSRSTKYICNFFNMILFRQPYCSSLRNTKLMVVVVSTPSRA